MMETVRGLILSIVMLTCQMCVFLGVYEPRKNTTKFWSVCIGFRTMIILIYICTVFTLGPVLAARLMIFTCTFPNVIFCLFMGRYTDGRFWVTYCFSDIAIAEVNVLSFVVLLMTVGDSFWPNLLIRSVAMVILTILIFVFIRKPYKRALGSMEHGWNWIGVVMVLFYIISAFSSTYPKAINERPEDYVLVLLIGIVITAAFCAFVHIILSMSRDSEILLEQKEERNELELARISIRQSQLQYRTIVDNIEKNRMLRHDLAHHLRVIENLCVRQRYEELNDYLQSMDVESVQMPLPYYSKNPIVNGLVGYYVSEAKEQGIHFEYELAVPEKIPADLTHVGVIIGNGLSNAMEACSKVRDYRFVEIVMRYVQPNLIICIKNSYGGEIVEKAGRLISTKQEPGHGIGLRSIQRIIKQDGGYCAYEYTENVFTLNVVLCCK